MADYSSLVLWLFLPQWLSTAIVRVLHVFWSSLTRRPRIQPNTKVYRRHYRWVFSVLIGSYFLYTIHATLYESRVSEYFGMFHVQPGTLFDVNQLKKSFRAYSRQFHPDKNDTKEAEEQFVRIRGAYEVLNDPKKRFLYERFGSGALDCSHCKTQQDFLHNALLQQTSVFYVATVLMMVVLQFASGSSGGTDGGSASLYQLSRYWGLAVLLTVEWTLLTRQNYAGRWAPFANAKTAAETIEFAHQLFIALTMALSQLLPIWTAPIAGSSKETQPRSRNLAALLRQLEAMVEFRVRETQFLRQLAAEPFSDKVELRDRLQQKIEKMVVDMRLFEENKEYSEVYRKVKGRKKGE